MAELDLAQPLGGGTCHVSLAPDGSQDHGLLPVMLEMTALVAVHVDEFTHEAPHGASSRLLLAAKDLGAYRLTLDL
jgi:hypothetical protein